MKLLRKKRIALLLLFVLLIVLFYKSNWLLRLVYPIHYRDAIEASSAKYNVDPLLIAAIIRVETNYKPDMVSPKGAIGIMQIMPDTAQWIFEREEFRHYTIKDLNNPVKNIQVGVQYVDLLGKQFHTQEEIVAAYNAGQGNVSKWRQSGRWDGTLEHADQIPFWETRKYVNRVSYYYRKYSQLYAEP